MGSRATGLGFIFASPQISLIVYLPDKDNAHGVLDRVSRADIRMARARTSKERWEQMLLPLSATRRAWQ